MTYNSRRRSDVVNSASYNREIQAAVRRKVSCVEAYRIQGTKAFFIDIFTLMFGVVDVILRKTAKIKQDSFAARYFDGPPEHVLHGRIEGPGPQYCRAPLNRTVRTKINSLQALS